jgi:hypothetical protein
MTQLTFSKAEITTSVRNLQIATDDIYDRRLENATCFTEGFKGDLHTAEMTYDGTDVCVGQGDVSKL